MPVSALVKNKLLLIAFLLLLLIDLAMIGYVSYLYLPKISSLVFPNQNKSPVVTEILQNINKKRTNKEYYDYINSISQVAIKSTNIAVADCTLSPLIITTNKSSSLTINNIGTTTTFITLGKQEPLQIEAHASITTNLSFVEGTPTVIGIGCSGKKEAAGILYVPK